MTNVLYMCFGIFLFVLGGIYPVLLETLRTYMKEYMLEEKREKQKARQKEKEIFEEAFEEAIQEMRELEEVVPNEENEPVERSYDEMIQTYTDVPKTSPEPPKSKNGAFFDYEPAIHDIDVEIVTRDREIELYKRAEAGMGLGGL